jgi:hypothetical protein
LKSGKHKYVPRKKVSCCNELLIGIDGDCEVSAICSWQAVESLFCFFYSVGILSGKMAGFLTSGLDGLCKSTFAYIETAQNKNSLYPRCACSESQTGH